MSYCLEENKMSAILMENNVFILEDIFGKRNELLDCRKLLFNKSSIPINTFTEGRTIPKFLVQLFHEHKERWRENEAGLYFLFDILITSFLIQKSEPFHVLEIGGESGILSYHLASLLGGFHKNSSLCSICHTIGNNSNNNWLDQISLVQEAPEYSLLVTDYDNTCLLDHIFDIVVVNGSINFFNPYRVLKEAERLVKNGGVIFVFLQDMPLLEDSFKLKFSERKEYYFTSSMGIMIKKDENRQKENERKEKEADYVFNFVKEVNDMLESGTPLEQIRNLMKRIDVEIDRAIIEYNIKQKIELIQVKEQVLDYIVRKEMEAAVL